MSTHDDVLDLWICSLSFGCCCCLCCGSCLPLCRDGLHHFFTLLPASAEGSQLWRGKSKERERENVSQDMIQIWIIFSFLVYYTYRLMIAHGWPIMATRPKLHNQIGQIPSAHLGCPLPMLQIRSTLLLPTIPHRSLLPLIYWLIRKQHKEHCVYVTFICYA